MGVIFISHSSRDNDRAIKVRDWLRANGWGETFLDLDPAKGLAPGQRWQEELKRAGERCSAIVALLSPNWLVSKWCQVEFLLASQLGKRIFGIIVFPVALTDLPIELTAHYQIVDVSDSARETEGFERLRLGLKRAGLDPKDFPWLCLANTASGKIRLTLARLCFANIPTVRDSRTQTFAAQTERGRLASG